VTEFGQGLILSGIGLLITFAALGILILVIIALKSLFPSPVSAEDELSPDNQKAPDMKDNQDREKLRKQAAAAAAAAVLARGRFFKDDLGKILESPRGSWWDKSLDQVHRKE